MHYEGKIYRPWIEADSLLIQATVGCTNNRCTFCDMFREKRFRVRGLDEVFRDIEEARRRCRPVGSIFLIDGNVLAVDTGHLLRVLEKLGAAFPECGRISLYAGLNDLRRKSAAELRELRQAGLAMAYAGLESGDPVTLQRIRKGLTPEGAVEGMARAKEAGIEVLLSFIFGLGGRERSREHIAATTQLLNRTRPEQIAPMTLTVQPGTELERQVRAGAFTLPTPLQVLEEEKYLLENLADMDLIYRGDHANNLVPLRGKWPESRARFRGRVERAIADQPVADQDELWTAPW